MYTKKFTPNYSTGSTITCTNSDTTKNLIAPETPAIFDALRIKCQIHQIKGRYDTVLAPMNVFYRKVKLD